jgi:hypothetical protein
VHLRLLAASALLLAALAGCVDQPCADGVTAQAIPGHKISVSWHPVENATAYGVVRAVDGGDPQPYEVVPGDQTTFVDTNVTAGHTYRYAVTTGPGVPLDECPPASASLADASVPFFGGAGLALAAAGALLGALLVLLRRR